MKSTSKRKVNILILSILLVIATIISGIVISFFYYKELENANANKEEKIKLDMNLAIKEEQTVEYMTTWNYEDFYKNLIDDKNIPKDTKVLISIDNKTLNQEDEYLFANVGSLNLEISLECDYSYKTYKLITNKIEVRKNVALNVVDNKIPVITGARDLETTVGSPLNLTDGITATDEQEGLLEVKCDTAIDFNVAGVYEVVFYAIDKNNNRAEAKITLTIKERLTTTTTTKKKTTTTKKPTTTTKASNDPSTKAGRLNLAKIEAKKVISQIIKPGMSDYDKARAICDYITNNVEVQSDQSSEAYKTNFGNEAYAALVLKIAACSGRCKAVSLLCEEVGISCQHINANEWTHQWNKVYIDGEWIVLDAQIGLLGGTEHPFEKNLNN